MFTKKFWFFGQFINVVTTFRYGLLFESQQTLFLNFNQWKSNLLSKLVTITMDIFKRLAYLHQAQNLLNQLQSSKNKTNDREVEMTNTDSNKPLIKLNSFFGYVSKEIAMKHNIQMYLSILYNGS